MIKNLHYKNLYFFVVFLVVSGIILFNPISALATFTGVPIIGSTITTAGVMNIPFFQVPCSGSESVHSAFLDYDGGVIFSNPYWNQTADGWAKSTGYDSATCGIDQRGSSYNVHGYAGFYARINWDLDEMTEPGNENPAVKEYKYLIFRDGLGCTWLDNSCTVDNAVAGDITFSQNSSGVWSVVDPNINFPFYAQIKNTSSGVSDLMDSPSTSANIVKTLPEDWIVYVASTTDSTGSLVTANGYNWYQVTDPTDNVSGWMIGENSSTNTQYLPYDIEDQSVFNATSSDYIATSSRPAVIMDAIDHYYNDNSTTTSLFSSDDGGNNISILKDNGFDEKIILGIAAQETGGIGFDNENVTYDYGHGIMQITPYQVFAHEATSDWADNTGDDRGIASGLSISPCKSNGSDLYENCYTHGGEYDSSDPKSYQHYEASSTLPEYKYYTNTSQSIYANIKDGLQILQSKYDNFYPISTSTTIDGVTFSAQDRENILVTEGYNGGDCGYVNDVAYKLDNIGSYFIGATTTDISDLVSKMHMATSTLCAQLHSPGDLSIQDSSGKVVGILNGQARDDFPMAIYNKNQKFVKVLFAGDEDYSYKVVGTAKGSYGLDVTIREGNQETEFHAKNIAILPGEIHTYSINKQALLSGQNDAVTLTVDRKGNGSIDRTINSGAILTSGVYNVGATPEELQAFKIGDISTDIQPGKIIVFSGGLLYPRVMPVAIPEIPGADTKAFESNIFLKRSDLYINKLK